MLSGGGYYYCALMMDGAARCWGSGTYGVLGNASIEYVGDSALETADQFPEVRFAVPIKQIGAGGSSVCAVLESGEVRCWGGGYGPLNQNNYHTDMGDDELASESAPYIPIRPLAE